MTFDLALMRSPDLKNVLVKELDQQRKLLQKARDGLQAGIEQYEAQRVASKVSHLQMTLAGSQSQDPRADR